MICRLFFWKISHFVDNLTNWKSVLRINGTSCNCSLAKFHYVMWMYRLFLRRNLIFEIIWHFSILMVSYDQYDGIFSNSNCEIIKYWRISILIYFAYVKYISTEESQIDSNGTCFTFVQTRKKSCRFGVIGILDVDWHSHRRSLVSNIICQCLLRNGTTYVSMVICEIHSKYHFLPRQRQTNEIKPLWFEQSCFLL